MKTPDLPEEKPSAPDKRNCTAGTLPLRLSTVRAAVLANALESNVLTGMDAVIRQSTTRLSAVIYALEHEYSWHFERQEVATGTTDGRVTAITTYWLSHAAIAQAFEKGARAWIDSVKAARTDRRKTAKKCQEQADRLNAARKLRKPADPRQGNLWGNI